MAAIGHGKPAVGHSARRPGAAAALCLPLLFFLAAVAPAAARTHPPFPADADFQEAQALLSRAEHRAARALFARFLDLHRSPPAYAAVARSYLAAGQIPDALATLAEAGRRDPGKVADALRLLLDHRGSDALAVLRESVRLHPEDPVGWQLLGRECAKVGRTTEAITAFRVAVRLDGRDVMFRLDLAEALERGGRIEAALVEYREAAGLRDDVRAWRALGDAYSTQRRFDEAAAAYVRAAERAPGDLDVLAGLGLAYAAVGNWARVSRVYQQLKAQDAAGAEEFLRIAVGKDGVMP